MAIVEIPLSKDKIALIDAPDVSLVSMYTWYAADRGGRWYAASSSVKRSSSILYLHRVIMAAPEGMHVDHINGNGLDCRRANMRLATNTENRHNMRAQGGVSRYKGVAFNRINANRKWEAYIWVNNKKRGLGNYPTEEEAARAYNAAAIVEYGDFARLNFIPGLTYEGSISPPVRNVSRGRPAGVRASRSSN